jgi:hypothetical protein
MNRLLRASAVALTLAVAGTSGLFAAGNSALVDFGKFSASAQGEFVEINITGPLLKFAAVCASKEEPAAAEVLRGLKHVRVNVVGLDDSNRTATTERVAAIRRDLTAQGWSQIVTVRGKKSEDVVIFAKIRADEVMEGLVITVIEGTKQAVLVNIVGEIKPDQIATLAEHLKIDGLNLAAKRVRS